MRTKLVRLIASEPNWLDLIYVLGIIAGMVFNKMTIVVGFGIILFVEVAFGVLNSHNKGRK